METCGGSPSGLVNEGVCTSWAASYGDGCCANSYSKSRPYWYRSSLPSVGVKNVFSLAMPQVSFTKSLPKLLVPNVLVACVWMPAGEAQRIRLKVNDARFFWLMFQSTLGKMMNCSPSRGVGPVMLTRPLN